MDLQGQKIPIDYFALDAQLKRDLFGSIGESAIELLDVAKALEDQNADWLRGCQNLATYYRALAQNLIAAQQVIFGRNVTGNSDVMFSGEANS